MRVFFVFSLNMRNSAHLYTRLWTHEQDIPWKPWRGEKINHRMQLLKFRTISVKAEKITVCQARGTAPLHAGAGAVAPPCALGWAGDAQRCPEWCPPACPGLVLWSDSSAPIFSHTWLRTNSVTLPTEGKWQIHLFCYLPIKGKNNKCWKPNIAAFSIELIHLLYIYKIN